MKQLKTIKNKKTCLPQGEITDWPAFRIRGFMHSCSILSQGRLSASFTQRLDLLKPERDS